MAPDEHDSTPTTAGKEKIREAESEKRTSDAAEVIAQDVEVIRSDLAEVTETARSELAEATEKNREELAAGLEVARENLAGDVEKARTDLAAGVEEERANVAVHVEAERIAVARNVRKIKLRENWYRDVWLFAITICLGAAVVFAQLQTIESRRDTIEQVCKSQNARNGATLAALDYEINNLPAGPQRDRANRNKEGTIRLLEAIQPYTEDCRAYAKWLVP